MSMDSTERAVRAGNARRALDGLSVGDALGRCSSITEDWDVMRPRRRVPAGPWRWTDDTAMADVIVGELERRGTIDVDALAIAFGDRFARDPQRGYGAVAYHVLTRIHEGVPWREIAPSVFSGQGSLGNGGAMRAAPLGGFFHDDVARVVREADASALPTHVHPDGRAGAIAVAVAAYATHNALPLLETVLAHTPQSATREGLALALQRRADSPLEAARALGTGVRVRSDDTVPFALWCVARHLGDFEAAIWTCLDGLETPDADRDTLLAIVGGVAALAPGAAIPSAWLGAREPLEQPGASR